MPCRLRSRVKLRVRLHHGDGRARCFRGSGALDAPMIPALNNRFLAAAAALTRLQGMLRQPQTDAGLYHARPARAGAPPASAVARGKTTRRRKCAEVAVLSCRCAGRDRRAATNRRKRNRAYVAKNLAKVLQASRSGCFGRAINAVPYSPAKSENRHAVLTFSVRTNPAGADSKRKRAHVFQRKPLIRLPKTACKYGRSDRIRTYDPLIPNQMRYQAALRSEAGDSIAMRAQRSIAK